MKHKSLSRLLPAVILILGAAVSASAFGSRESGTRNVSGFDAISLETAGRLYLVQGEDTPLLIDAPPNITERIIAEVKNGTLHIRYRGWFSGFGAQPVYRVGMKNVRALTAASSGHIETKDIIAENLDLTSSSSGHITIESVTTKKLETRVSSSGDIRIDNLMATTLNAILSSSGNLTFTGMVKEQSVKGSSSGEFNAGNLKSSTTTVNLSSSGNATLWVVDELNASLSSSGHLRYYGNPKIGELKISSSGGIKSLGEK